MHSLISPPLLQLPDICIHSQVFAEYSIELTTSSGGAVFRWAEIYQQSNFVEQSLTLEAATYYTLNSSVFVPTHAELGSATTINHFRESPSPLYTTFTLKFCGLCLLTDTFLILPTEGNEAT